MSRRLLSTPHSPPPPHLPFPPPPPNLPLSQTNSSSTSDWLVAGLITGMAAALLVALTATIIACLLWRQRWKVYSAGPPLSPERLATSAESSEVSTSSDTSAAEKDGANTFDIQKVISFKLKDLAEATDNFSSANHLGQGSYGMVYKAKLKSGDIAAVKRAKQDRKQDLAKFKKEIELLSRVSHKNLVRLIGYCREGSEQLLVYEFIGGGNLSQNLNPQWRAKQSRPPLNWTERLLIAAGTARGLAYLHEEINMPFIHRDVKASNIMVDRHVVAKLADFGTSKPMTVDELRKMSATIQGTAGYCDPDYLQSGKPSKRIDVYSFGIVLLELITGEGPHKVSRPYRFYIKDKFERSGLADLVDESMGLYPEEELRRILDLAFRCTDIQDPSRRPTMSRVVTEIEAVLEPEMAIQLQKSSSRRGSFVPMLTSSGSRRMERVEGVDPQKKEEPIARGNDSMGTEEFDVTGVHSYGDLNPA